MIWAVVHTARPQPSGGNKRCASREARPTTNSPNDRTPRLAAFFFAARSAAPLPSLPLQGDDAALRNPVQWADHPPPEELSWPRL